MDIHPLSAAIKRNIVLECWGKEQCLCGIHYSNILKVWLCLTLCMAEHERVAFIQVRKRKTELPQGKRGPIRGAT